MLEATVARLESALFQLQSSSISGPPPIPPRGLPPSPRRSARLDDAIPHALFQANAPQPLQHSPPLSSRSSHRPNQPHTPLLAHQANTPRPPNQPPPLASPATPSSVTHTTAAKSPCTYPFFVVSLTQCNRQTSIISHQQELPCICEQCHTEQCRSHWKRWKNTNHGISARKRSLFWRVSTGTVYPSRLCR